MSAPPFQFPASLPTAVNQPAGQSSVVISQDKFVNSETLLSGVGDGSPVIQGKTHIPSQDSYANNAQALTCLGSGRPSTPPGNNIPSSDLYATAGVVLSDLETT